MTHPLLTLIALLTSFILQCSDSHLRAAPRPNILYFYVDDMGWGSIGPNAQAARRAAGLPSVRTPNLDALAAAGINFTRAYGCTVCSPARSSQQTGFHQGHTFADRNDPDNAKKAIRTDDITMGDALSKAGYTTGYWGKWGYGGSKDQKNPTLDNLQTLPSAHGYQHILAELHHVRAHTFFQPTLWHAPAPKGTQGGLTLLPNTMRPYVGNDNYPAQPANHNHPDYPSTGYCDDLYATHALDFVRRNARACNESGTPFFGLLAVQIPHAPFAEIAQLPDWDAAYKDDPLFADLAGQTKQWAAMVTRIDAHFGNILAALDDPDGDGDHSDSVAGNTLVIFMSDNGGPGGKNLTELDANGGLRGVKGSIQEGGIRVPTIMRWPAMINAGSRLKAGTSTDRILDVTDLLPTFCDLAGAEIPLGIDGVSLAPTLTGEGVQRLRDFIIHEAGNGQSIIRGKYKLVRSAGKKGRNASFQLFDLEKDRAEKTDISASDKQRVAELTTLLLGERVTEQPGFANTYHRWGGKSGANTSNPDNWSDYLYENAGITYIQDTGAPQLSWTTLMENPRSKPSTATGDKDLAFLALEIRGDLDLQMGKGINLTARNELRLSEGATLTLDGGKLSTLRRIDIHKGATLQGHGKVEGDLHNEGTMNLSVNTERLPAFEIAGTANLGGELALTFDENFAFHTGMSLTLLTAGKIEGKFTNPGQTITAPSDMHFTIHYTPTTITLEGQRLTVAN